MDKLERIGISLESSLLRGFDRLVEQKKYPNRSEAVRDLIRAALAQKQVENPDTQAVAALLLLYDHHTPRLGEKLNNLQHSHLLEVIAATHIHLDHHNCLEAVFLNGRVGQIQALADSLAGLKGVKLSRLTLMDTVAAVRCKNKNE